MEATHLFGKANSAPAVYAHQLQFRSEQVDRTRGRIRLSTPHPAAKYGFSALGGIFLGFLMLPCPFGLLPIQIENGQLISATIDEAATANTKLRIEDKLARLRRGGHLKD